MPYPRTKSPRPLRATSHKTVFSDSERRLSRPGRELRSRFLVGNAILLNGASPAANRELGVPGVRVGAGHGIKLFPSLAGRTFMSDITPPPKQRPPKLSFRPEQPDFFLRAEFRRVGPRSGGIPWLHSGRQRDRPCRDGVEPAPGDRPYKNQRWRKNQIPRYVRDEKRASSNDKESTLE